MNRIAVILGGVLLVSGVAGAQSMYKWVDEQGNVTYQDYPPPGQDESNAVFADEPELKTADSGASGGHSTVASVVLYSVPNCDACDLVRHALEKYGVPYTDKDASASVAVQNELKQLIGQLSVPLLDIGGNLVSGYSSVAIESGLANAGYRLNDEDNSAQGQSSGSDGGLLSEAEVTEQATDAAAELTSGLDGFATEETSFLDSVEEWEEIPEDEQIKVNIDQ